MDVMAFNEVWKKLFGSDNPYRVSSQIDGDISIWRFVVQQYEKAVKDMTDVDAVAFGAAYDCWEDDIVKSLENERNQW